MKDRQYEMALMRTYGATRWQLVELVLLEGLLITSSGFILGIIFSRIGLWLISVLMESNYHYSFIGWAFVAEEIGLLVVALSVGALASLLPAIRVFNLDISKILADA
jgi:putative ABC transport system permease protein